MDSLIYVLPTQAEEGSASSSPMAMFFKTYITLRVDMIYGASGSGKEMGSPTGW